MQIFHDMHEWMQVRTALEKTSLGFVPTMGNLHIGHTSLVAQSQQENAKTIVSIFINPTQFNQAEDFQHYPRTLEQDLDILKNMQVDYCLLPNEKFIYADHYSYQVTETKLSQLMEGKHRGGHFTGVLTVVMKLFNLVKPNTVYFGEKDYQQYLLIRDMVAALFMDISIQACPTIREPSGLAYSSRNNRLSTDERALAEKFARIFHQDKSCQALVEELQHHAITVEYLEEYQGRRFVAVRIGDIRLIDNYLIP